MSVPNFDINNSFVINNLPFYKRLSKWIQTFRGYLGSLSWLNSIFNKYMNGSDDLTFYSSIVSYNKYDRVTDVFGVYESQVDSNLGNNTSDTDFWLKVQNHVVGVYERVSYVCRQLQLEYALNHYFKQQLFNNGFIGWQQPTSMISGDYFPKSNIFVTSVVPSAYSIISFLDIQPYNLSFLIPNSYYSFSTLIISIESYYQFAVNIPIDVYDSLGSTDKIKESVIKNFVDKICVSGIKYIIKTY